MFPLIDVIRRRSAVTRWAAASELAGRDRLIEDAAIDMDRLLERRPTKGMMLLGLRGVGKTALLNRLHYVADGKGIHTAKIGAPEGGMERARAM